DHALELERNEIRNVRTNRHLALETAAGEAAVVDQRLPENAFSLGGIPTQQTRQPAYRPALPRHAATAMLSQQIAQFLRPGGIKDAAARRAFASLHDGIDHPMQCADVLLRRRHALEDIAQVDAHGPSLFLGTEELNPFQLTFEIGEKRIELL